jgi:hypothetical protein
MCGRFIRGHDAITKYWDYESFMDARRCRPTKLKRAVATIKNGREGKGEAARWPGHEWHPFAAAPIIDRRNADECLLLLPGSRQADKYRRGSVERTANISEARSHFVEEKYSHGVARAPFAKRVYPSRPGKPWNNSCRRTRALSERVNFING